jgi:RimJ/RimL family protein N-acetyltransferase
MIHLTTERLVLRDWQASDLDAWAAINADPEVRRHLGDGMPAERKDAWHMMAAASGNQVLNGFGMWAAEERATGHLIGRIGLYQPPHFPDLEVNWLLGRPWWGRSLAHEGATACIDHAFRRLDRSTISAFIDAGNERSMRLARRLAMIEVGEPWPGVHQFQKRRET